ncbi:hypothetical protein C7974DRAFT_397570 [Boeremia exigua]|uniref:uncharacterized protein n=1 Tax=Boeremia exigua TaxID=749465 RepID=UPI001E8E11F7|nr:uncharacterized protein C7974DRAFT_397570 [Boeremia exigua]KAH6622048.1 hypothetical protein C7974DRAFT_397570 [Boeremia exigua]
MTALADLPAELLSRIAFHLFDTHPQSHKFEDNGFRSFRLSCRCLESKTRYTFERAAFSTMTVTLHAKSLSRLRDVSRHVLFGKLIKKLVFIKAHHPVFDEDIAPLEFGRPPRKHEHAGYGVIELPKHGIDGVYPNEGLVLKKRVRLGLQDCLSTIMAHASGLKEVVVEPNFMASFWLDTPSRQDQLNERAQRIYQMTLESNARDYERYEDGYESEEAEEPDSDFDVMDGDNEDYDSDEISDPYDLETYVDPDYLLYLVATAVQRNGLQLSALSSFSVAAFCIRARTFVEITPVLQSVQHVSISINASNVLKLRRKNGSALHAHENGEPTAKSLGHALSTLRDLQSLTLAFDNYHWEDDRVTNISKSLRGFGDKPFRQLSSVNLSLACFEGRGLLDFLRGSTSTLQQLFLRRIILATTHHWRPILRMMVDDMPKLTKVRCEELTGGEGFGDTSLLENCVDGWKGCCIMDCSERQDVLIGVKQALENFPHAFAQSSDVTLPALPTTTNI